MSQAVITHNTSRRGFLSGLASFPVVGGAAMLTSASAADADPIHAAIARHNAAVAAMDEASAAEGRIERTLPDDMIRRPRVRIGFVRTLEGEKDDLFAYSEHEIAEYLEGSQYFRPTEHVERLGTKWRAELAADAAMLEAAHGAAGLTEARERAEAAHIEEVMAADAVLSTMPTTIEGLVAFASHVLEHCCDGPTESVALTTMARALRGLATSGRA